MTLIACCGVQKGTEDSHCGTAPPTVTKDLIHVTLIAKFDADLAMEPR